MYIFNHNTIFTNIVLNKLNIICKNTYFDAIPLHRNIIFVNNYKSKAQQNVNIL